MAGYLGNDEATRETIDDDGWLRTGDMARVDSSGCVYIVDRLKELIKYKGYQVPPAELEAVLLTHPAIADAAVIGVRDAESGEEVPKAFVVKQSGAELTEAEVMEFVAAEVAPYKKVRQVEFIDAIPKSASGKILRKDLRTELTPAATGPPAPAGSRGRRRPRVSGSSRRARPAGRSPYRPSPCRTRPRPAAAGRMRSTGGSGGGRGANVDLDRRRAAGTAAGDDRGVSRTCTARGRRSWDVRSGCATVADDDAWRSADAVTGWPE